MNPISCAIMHELIINGSLEKSINQWRSILNNNCNNLYECLCSELGQYIVNIEKPNGGYFMWLKINTNSENLSKLMEDYKIKFHHGKKFSSQSDACYYIRLSFSWYIANDYLLFVKRFKKLLDDEYNKTIPHVYILGHNGRLGKLICEELNKTNDLLFNGGLNRTIDLDKINKTHNNNIIIDVSSPEGTQHLISKLVDLNLNVKLIIGTTGKHDMDIIQKYSINNPVFLCSNFSIGISEFKKIIDTLDKNIWYPTLIEKHHIHKKDAPSGTAKTLANTYNKFSEKITFDNIQSIRESEIIGIHELVLENTNETLTISHVAKSRNLFASGCVNLIKKIINHNYNGLFDYDLNTI
jgi:4-hydroxy-tetrahydrodipicolinate reductase